MRVCSRVESVHAGRPPKRRALSEAVHNAAMARYAALTRCHPLPCRYKHQNQPSQSCKPNIHTCTSAQKEKNAACPALSSPAYPQAAASQALATPSSGAWEEKTSTAAAPTAGTHGCAAPRYASAIPATGCTGGIQQPQPAGGWATTP